MRMNERMNATDRGREGDTRFKDWLACMALTKKLEVINLKERTPKGPFIQYYYFFAHHTYPIIFCLLGWWWYVCGKERYEK